MKETTSTRSRLVVWLLALVAVLGLTAAGYLYWQNQELRKAPPTSEQSQKDRAAEVKAKVAKLISVPADETPTLANVTDKSKLKDQPFFKDAQNGDQILIFPQAKKAIIYRESENRLINVGPIAITSDAAAAGTTQEQSTQTQE